MGCDFLGLICVKWNDSARLLSQGPEIRKLVHMSRLGIHDIGPICLGN